MFGMIYKNQKCLLNNLTWATGRAIILKHFLQGVPTALLD